MHISTRTVLFGFDQCSKLPEYPTGSFKASASDTPRSFEKGTKCAPSNSNLILLHAEFTTGLLLHVSTFSVVWSVYESLHNIHVGHLVCRLLWSLKHLNRLQRWFDSTIEQDNTFERKLMKQIEAIHIVLYCSLDARVICRRGTCPLHPRTPSPWKTSKAARNTGRVSWFWKLCPLWTSLRFISTQLLSNWTPEDVTSSRVCIGNVFGEEPAMVSMRRSENLWKLVTWNEVWCLKLQRKLTFIFRIKSLHGLQFQDEHRVESELEDV